MEHMRKGKAEFVPFDPHAKQPKMSYKVMPMHACKLAHHW
jgi:hypothetical protein